MTGFELDPEFAQTCGPFLQQVATRPQPAVHDIESRRVNLSGLMAIVASKLPETPDIQVKEHQITTRDGTQIALFQINKQQGQGQGQVGVGEKGGPAVLYIHGGGMISGSASEWVPLLKQYVEPTSVSFFAVDYRRAPQVQGEVLVNDCYDALEWVVSQAQSLGVDPKRIAVMGDSAGGGLAAGVALQARDRKLSPALAKQILVYPMLDDRNLTPNPALVPFALWSYESNLTGWSALLGSQAGQADAAISPYCAPARATSLEGLPATYMDVGQLDIFAQEDLTYATRLHQANVQIRFTVYPGFPHAWELVGGLNTSTGRRIFADRIAAVASF